MSIALPPSMMMRPIVFGDRHDLVDARRGPCSRRALRRSPWGRKILSARSMSSSREAFLEQRFGGMSTGSLQLLHSLRARRCAMIRTHRGRDGVGLHAHVDETRQRLRGVVGVQRGQHQVAGLRGLDGDFRRLEVADFADHDDVRILAQERAQRGRRT